MKWMEIIRLCAFDRLRQTDVMELLDQLTAELSTADVTCTLYQRAAVATDISIHLVWHSDILEYNKSLLGAKLVYLLQEFGSVDYSVWIETLSL